MRSPVYESPQRVALLFQAVSFVEYFVHASSSSQWNITDFDHAHATILLIYRTLLAGKRPGKLKQTGWLVIRERSTIRMLKSAAYLLTPFDDSSLHRDNV